LVVAVSAIVDVVFADASAIRCRFCGRFARLA